MAFKEYSGNITAKGFSFAIVVSRFNSFMTEQLLKGAIDCIERHGGDTKMVTVARVPGAYEIPTIADKLAATGKFNAVIALGAVIRGATPHADLINAEVSKALAQISLARSIPVINGVIAADNIEQAIERSGTKAGNKGWDAAQTAMEMASLCGMIG